MFRDAPRAQQLFVYFTVALSGRERQTDNLFSHAVQQMASKSNGKDMSEGAAFFIHSEGHLFSHSNY